MKKNAAIELPLNDERKEVKKPRHVVIAINHLIERQRRKNLLAKKSVIDVELKALDEAILAIDVELKALDEAILALE